MLYKTIVREYFETDRYFYKGGFYGRDKFRLSKWDYVFAANEMFIKKYGMFKFVWRFKESRSNYY